MVIEIGDKLVSTDLFTEEFVCNLNACRGACCIEGNDGAPLTMDEVDLIEAHIDEIIPFVSEAGKEVIEKEGVYYLDQDNEPVTELIGDHKDCVFVTIDEKGIAKCGIENAYREGSISFNKPISCHLYPIREKQVGDMVALPVLPRFARLVSTLDERYGFDRLDGSRIIDRRVSQRDLGRLLGTTSKSVGRAVRTLRESGVLQLDGHRIQVLDQQGLFDAAHPPPTETG